MNEIKTILMTSDHRPTINVVKAIVPKEYEVEVVKTGAQAINRFKERTYEAVILDVNLPDTNGFEVCSTIRNCSEVPIVFLTSAASESDKVNGFSAGADEYITKPFGHMEFISRLGRLLNRKKITKNSVTAINGVEINHFSKDVKVDGELVHLTPTEFDMLRFRRFLTLSVAIAWLICSLRSISFNCKALSAA